MSWKNKGFICFMDMHHKIALKERMGSISIIG